ncbi:MAG: site-2 protease family protein, partial [Pseudomonadota bacterium]
MSEILSQGPLFIASVLLFLGLIVVVHELGHYWAGRYFGVATESFSVGFGGSIAERRDKNGTRWRINWIPFGGFVRFIVERPEDPSILPHLPKGRFLNDLGPGARSIIFVAGPAAN